MDAMTRDPKIMLLGGIQYDEPLIPQKPAENRFLKNFNAEM